jgi:hypothetical protein
LADAELETLSWGLALLKSFAGTPEEHQVVGEDAQDGLSLLRGGATRGERGTQPPLVAAARTLRVPPLMVQRAGEVPSEHSVFGPGELDHGVTGAR